MAARATNMPSTQQQSVCDNCHQKPSFAPHKYCSKTCASQATSLCNQCHKKPKFQGFEFCGKSCAAAAGGTVNKPRGPNAQAARGNAPAQKAQIDPMQIAQLLVQNLPQLQGMLPQTQNNSAQAHRSVPQAMTNTNSLGMSGIPAPHNASSAPPKNNPFLTIVTAANKVLSSSNNNNNGPMLEDCKIPGCREPAHVDASGQKISDYCSMRHREEAVASGLSSPCIFCLTHPQSETDYFCGYECRNEAMSGKEVIGAST